MHNCSIIVRHITLSNPNQKGICIWRYSEIYNMHILYILLNQNLFIKTDTNSRVMAKEVAVHEFVHCIAAMLSFSGIKTEKIQKSLFKAMCKRIHAMSLSEAEMLLAEMATSWETGISKVFKDEHFRTQYESFNKDYIVLYNHLLFSKQLFDEYFSKEILKKIKTSLQEQKISEAEEYIRQTINKLSQEKALPYQFIINMIKDYKYIT